MEIDLARLITRVSTYPNRSGRSYELRYRTLNQSSIEIYYTITRGAATREVRRKFPRVVTINERFLWVLGLLRGEGLKSRGSKSSMYRFNVVNNDLAVIKSVIRVLDESNLAKFEEVKGRGGLVRISYGPNCDTREARRFWAVGLDIEIGNVEIAQKPEPQKRAIHGSCMFTINDVLLRRVMDLIADYVYTQQFVQRL